MKKAIFLFLFVGILCCLYASNRDNTPWWLENYGDYAKTKGKNDPRVKWAFSVFQRVKKAADKSKVHTPRLFILGSRSGPYAMALPDGGILINPTTLEISYKGVSRIEGDQRLAFILGHELAHLANDDFMHRKAFMALQEYGEKRALEALKKIFRLPENRTKELLADKKGALYAAMAGYKISGLFGEKNNFLKDWARQIGIGYSYEGYTRYPSFEKRVQFIRPQLLAVSGQVELFKAGVLMYQVGGFYDSEAAFREFARIYPSREVFNNIGACNLNLALHHIYLKYHRDYYRFRFSTAVDYSTTAETLHMRGEWDYLNDKDIAGYLTKAEEFFRRAVNRDKIDHACRHNLAVALILKKEYARAQAECDFILKTNPQDVYALNNKAIAFYYYGQEEDLDTGQKAIQILEKAHQLKPGNYEVLYNLASLKEKRKRLAGAKQYWEKYLNSKTTPRDNFYNYVCEKVNRKSPSVTGGIKSVPPSPGGLTLGEDFSAIVKKWGKEYVKEFRLGSEENESDDGWFIRLQVIVKGNIRVLALDGIVEIIEREFSPGKAIASDLARYGLSPKILRHTGGNFYIYEDRGFSIKEIAGKVRSYTWFERRFAAGKGN